MTNCFNCREEIKSGMFKSNAAFNTKTVTFINAVLDKDFDGLCDKCGSELKQKALGHHKEKVSQMERKLQSSIHSIPILSTHSPYNWNYESIGIVTGQTTMGTGVVTEFTSSFTDLFGAQSGRHNEKIRKGEQLCMAQLRKQALDLGANAIIATDIDYGEIGGVKAMLMICMTGTAVFLKNTEELNPSTETALIELRTSYKKFIELKKLKN